MANTIPTTKEIYNIIIASFEANYGQKIPILKKAFLRVSAKVLSGLYVILYKYAGFLGLQMFTRFASASETIINGETVIPIVEWGRQLGLGDPAAAIAAELEITITVNNQSGFLPSGTPLLSPINNITYITTGSILLNAATVTGVVIATFDQNGNNGSGTNGNLDIGDTMSFINPQSNVNQQTIVNQIIVTGVDAENIDTEYRQRVIDRQQNPPQGGAYADYVIWGLEVNGIIGIFPYTGITGEVDVYAEATPESSSNQDGIPTQAQLDAVLESIILDDDTGLATRRPVSAFTNVHPISRIGFDVVVYGLQATDIALVRKEIEDALKEYFLSRSPYIAAISVPPRVDRITSTAVGGVIQDVVSAYDAIFDSFDLELNSFEIITYTLGEGMKSKSSGVTFVA